MAIGVALCVDGCGDNEPAGPIDDDGGGAAVGSDATVDRLAPYDAAVSDARMPDAVLGQGGPDLRVEIVSAAVLANEPWSAPRLEVAVRNVGAAPAAAHWVVFAASFDDKLDADDVPIGSVHVQPLMAGSMASNLAALMDVGRTSDFDLMDVRHPSRRPFIVARVDCTNAVAERDETNNDAAVAMPAGVEISGSDLRVHSLRPHIHAVKAGSKLAVDVALLNAGNAPTTPRTSQVAAVVGPFAQVQFGPSLKLPILAPGATDNTTTVSLAVPSVVAGTTAAVGIVAGAANDVDAANNQVAVPIQITAGEPPNLKISALAIIAKNGLNSAYLAAGEPAMLSLQLHNSGGGIAPSTTLAVYLSDDDAIDRGDTLLAQATAAALGPAAVTTILIDVTGPIGLADPMRHVGVLIDPLNDVVESDEHDNAAAIKVVIDSRPDVAALELSATKPVCKPGGTLNARVVVSNLGGADASVRTDSTALFDGAGKLVATLGKLSAAALSAGQRQSIDVAVALPNALTPGSYTFRMLLDTDKQLVEGSEANNSIEIPITVAADGGARIGGHVTYARVPAVGDGGGGARLDYAKIAEFPVRFAVVRAVAADDQEHVWAAATTDHSGAFELWVPTDTAVKVQVLARSRAAMGMPSGPCPGGRWDVRIADNTADFAQYTLASAVVIGPSNGLHLHAGLSWSGTYGDRTSAPFAVLDTIVGGIAQVCAWRSGLVLPPLRVGWSGENGVVAGSKWAGQIGNAHFIVEGGAGDVGQPSQPTIYLRGQQDVDTDEFDASIVLHELGHFIEYAVSRSDSPGGSHLYGALLLPELAWSEGFATAFAAMVAGSALALDSKGAGQAHGVGTNLNLPPVGLDRGVYSERSVQHLIWRVSQALGGGSDGLSMALTIVADRLRASPYSGTLHAFAAHLLVDMDTLASDTKVAAKGRAALIQSWTQDLATPLDALCVGACASSGPLGKPDPIDADGDAARWYGMTRADAAGMPGLAAPSRWRLARALASSIAPLDAHNTLRAIGAVGSGGAQAVLGSQRLLYFVGDGAPHTIAVLGSNDGTECGDAHLTLHVSRVTAVGRRVTVAADQRPHASFVGAWDCPAVHLQTGMGVVYAVRVGLHKVGADAADVQFRVVTY